jgi:hypothetical protein
MPTLTTEQLDQLESKTFTTAELDQIEDSSTVPLPPKAAAELETIVWNDSIAQEIPLSKARKALPDVQETQKKYDSIEFWRQINTPVGFPGVLAPPPVPLNPIKTLSEVPKGVARSLQRDFAGGTGTMFDWFGQLIQEGGAALQQFSEIGTKNKGQVYNPVAESIIALGEGVSKIGTESRKAWAISASTGWEKFDNDLKETDPISYGAARISEGLTSSALSVLAAYMSGGSSASLNAGVQINRGLALLAAFSAAGSFEHAQSTGENFYWSTAHGIADGAVEYAMESTFLEGINTSTRLGAGAKEGTEEFFTGMIQNTRANILENTNKGMSAYEATKKAVGDSLRQSPWEVAAGFIGGYGIKGGADFVEMVKKGNAIPLETDVTPEGEGELPLVGDQVIGEDLTPTPEPKTTKQVNQKAISDAKVVKKDLDKGEISLQQADKKANQIEEKRLKDARKAQKTDKPPKPAKVESIEKDDSEAINRVMESLQKAKEAQPVTKAEQRVELKKRVGAAAGALKTSVAKGEPIDEAVLRSTGLLKGPLTEYEQVFESIEDVLTPEDKQTLFAKIYEQPNYFDVLDSTRALKKLIAGTALTNGDITSIERVFGKTFSDITSDRLPVSSLYDRAVALWKAGLLTGLKTQGLNVMSNMVHAVTETASTIPAAGFDTVASLFTGERTLALTTKGSVKGTKEGFKRGWDYLTTGHDERDVGTKLDFRKVNFGTSKFAKALQTYEETIFHMLGAADQPFYYGAKAKSLASQAIAQGKTKGLKGAELKAFVDKTINAPTDRMLEVAAYDAEVAVFQNRTVFGDIARAVQKAPGGEIVVPFGRTPAAVATQIINYTPVGVIAEVAKQAGKGKLNQRKLSQAVGRSVAGTGALWLGGQLLTAGLMTLDRPRNEREKKLWELEGRKPNSILVNGKWRSVQVLGPGGSVLIVGGHFQDQMEKTGSPTEALVQAATGGAKSFSEQTFVKGMNTAMQAMTDPDRSFENWFSSMAGSVVPTIVSDIARANDDVERRTKGAAQRVQSRIPGLREDLPPRIDVFGQDVPRYGGNILEVMIDPSRPAIVRQDVVVSELRRLADNTVKVSPTLLGEKHGFAVLTPEENTQLWRRTGELTYKGLLALVNSPGYQSIKNDFAKGEEIKRIVNTARTFTKAEIAFIKMKQGVSVVDLANGGLISLDEIEAINFFTRDR